MRKKRCKFIRGLGWIFLSIICVIGVFFAISEITPDPVAYITRSLFSGFGKGTHYPQVSDFSEYESRVIETSDTAYPSSVGNNTLDFIMPANPSGSRLPVLFWVHGGAFVGGDKADARDYMVMLANEGLVVVNVNYGLTPEVKYPNQILQLKEAYDYISANAEQYDVDISKVVLGGDSAGASIVGQFVNAQVNDAYAKDSGISQVIATPTDIKGVVFLSGLLNTKEIDETGNAVIDYMFNKSAWAYYGDKNWKDSVQADFGDLAGHVGGSFPPTFITDGKNGSFESQAKTLEAELRSLNVSVTSKYYDSSLGHEYQFIMDYPESLETYDALKAFLSEVLR